MASRKLNVLLYAFTDKAETLQSGSSDISHDIYRKTQQNKTPNRTLTENYKLT